MQDFYNLIKLLLYPEVWIFIALGLGCLLSWITRSPHSLRLILCLSFVFYYGFTTRPLAQALVEPLETYYQPPAALPHHADAIVLFVNNPPMMPPFSDRPTIVGTRSADLLICGLTHVHALRIPKIVLAEGRPRILPHDARGRGVLQEWAVLLGYPTEAILVDDQAVETHARARAIKQLLGSDNKILLVDASIHLPRSVAAFRKAGLVVTPMPCDYYSISGSWSFSDFVPSAGNLVASSEAIYEYAGLLVYWLRGFI